MSKYFLIKSFLKTTFSVLTHNADEKNQALKLLLVTAAVDLVSELNLWARKCSSVIFFIISNTLL